MHLATSISRTINLANSSRLCEVRASADLPLNKYWLLDTECGFPRWDWERWKLWKLGNSLLLQGVWSFQFGNSMETVETRLLNLSKLVKNNYDIAPHLAFKSHIVESRGVVVFINRYSKAFKKLCNKQCKQAESNKNEHDINRAKSHTWKAAKAALDIAPAIYQ